MFSVQSDGDIDMLDGKYKLNLSRKYLRFTKQYSQASSPKCSFFHSFGEDDFDADCLSGS